MKSFTVGGSVGTLAAYRIQMDGKVGAVKIGGSIIGQGTNRSLVIGGEVGSFSVGGSIIGSAADISGSGSQIELGKAKSISVAGALHGKAGAGGGTLRVLDGGKMGAVKIGGSVIGGTGDRAGKLDLTPSAASITIGGSLLGNSGSRSGSVSAGSVGSVKIGGSIIGDVAVFAAAGLKPRGRSAASPSLMTSSHAARTGRFSWPATARWPASKSAATSGAKTPVRPSIRR